MRAIRTKAIILRRTNYGEADRIIQVLTPDHGKLSVVAKGVRKEKSKLAGGIELFARCDINVSFGKSEMGILTGARLEIFYAPIMHDYDRLTFAYEAIKQVAKAADALDEPAFFELIDQTFYFLAASDVQLEITKAWFWLQLGVIMGQGMNLSTDDSGMKLVEDACYNFDETQSVFVYRENGRFSSEHIKLMRVLTAQSPNVVMNVRGLGELLPDCLWLAERSIAH